jgi:hypothetical protein
VRRDSFETNDNVSIACPNCGHQVPYSLAAVLVPLDLDHPEYNLSHDGIHRKRSSFGEDYCTCGYDGWPCPRATGEVI